jgi:hypothetical protein
MQATTIRRTPLEARLALQGWLPGAPAHVPPAIVDVDNSVGKAMKCGACRRRGMQFIPLHRGTVYRVVLHCRCGNHEEL